MCLFIKYVEHHIKTIKLPYIFAVGHMQMYCWVSLAVLMTPVDLQGMSLLLHVSSVKVMKLISVRAIDLLFERIIKSNILFPGVEINKGIR